MNIVEIHTPRHSPREHKALIRTTSARTSTPRWHWASWKEHRITCCEFDAQRKHGILLAVTDKPPVMDFDPDSDGGLTPQITQCGRCGQYQEAEVEIRALTEAEYAGRK